MILVLLAFVAGLVVAPTAVEAAKNVQKVVIADAKKPTKTVKVDGKGRIKAVVSGKVATPPNRPAPPARPFHRESMQGGTTNAAVGAPVPRGRNVALTSVTVMSTPNSGSGWSRLYWAKAVNGGCAQQGSELQRIADFYLGHSSTVDIDRHFLQTYPVPQIRRATDTPLCLRAISASGLVIVVDGYTY